MTKENTYFDYSDVTDLAKFLRILDKTQEIFEDPNLAL